MRSLEVLTNSQEAFCLAFALPDERGRATSATDAYSRSYPNASRRTAMQRAHELMQTPKIKARIAEIRKALQDELQERLASAGIANQAQRVLDKNERHLRLQEVMAERAALGAAWQQTVTDLQHEWLNVQESDPDFGEKRISIENRLKLFMAEVGAGESTGVLARDFKSVGERVCSVFKFDKAIYDAMLDLEESVAKELGQITEKKEHSGGIRIIVEYGDDSPAAPAPLASSDRIAG